MVTPIIRLSTYRSTIRDNKKFVWSKSIILIQFVQSERNLVKRNIVSIHECSSSRDRSRELLPGCLKVQLNAIESN